MIKNVQSSYNHQMCQALARQICIVEGYNPDETIFDPSKDVFNTGALYVPRWTQYFEKAFEFYQTVELCRQRGMPF